jgi:hypothetical protein
LNTLERVMRVMTHVNIGATLGTGVWILWSGLMIVGAPLQAMDAPPAAVHPNNVGTVPRSCGTCSPSEAHPGHHHEGHAPMSGRGPAVAPRSDT